MTVNQEISSQQAELASSLGISLDESTSLRQLMLELDKALGQQYLLEQARYFILSAYRHLTKANWESISESGLSLEQQYELAEIFVGSDKFKQSLITVLKDPRTRFTLLGFIDDDQGLPARKKNTCRQRTGGCEAVQKKGAGFRRFQQSVTCRC